MNIDEAQLLKNVLDEKTNYRNCFLFDYRCLSSVTFDPDYCCYKIYIFNHKTQRPQPVYLTEIIQNNSFIHPSHCLATELYDFSISIFKTIEILENKPFKLSGKYL